MELRPNYYPLGGYADNYLAGKGFTYLSIGSKKTILSILNIQQLQMEQSIIFIGQQVSALKSEIFQYHYLIAGFKDGDI
jgi:hypothetical protein